MIRPVVKHSYIKGAKGKARAKAHVNYIQHRAGEDKEKGARAFFDKEDERVLGREVKQRIDEQSDRGVTIHKLILSPGSNVVDLKKYTREVMGEIGSAKGLDLEWYAVGHANTDHNHVHVVVMGRDREGNLVRFDRDDYKELRQIGERYLEREHQLDRYLDKELERIISDPTYKTREQRQLEREFSRLEYGEDGERKRGKDLERERQEFEKFDKDLHNIYGAETGRQRRMTFEQFQTESAGRLTSFHETATMRDARERWKEIAAENPELAAAAEKELQWLDELAREQQADRSLGRDRDIDRLIDGKTEDERDWDRTIERELGVDAEQSLRGLLREEEQNEQGAKKERGHRDFLSDLIQSRKERDAGETFERDRQSKEAEEKPERDDEEKNKERHRGDDFGR